jgi:hypothetical protein
MIPTAAPARRASTGRGTPGSSGTPLALRCALFLAVLKLALTVRGLDRTLQWIRVATINTAPDREKASVADIVRAVATAAALYPGRARCLEQSMTLYYYLRRAGADARLRLGVKPHPFTAHSWVEIDGAPVNDFPEHIGHYLAFPDPGRWEGDDLSRTPIHRREAADSVVEARR